EDNMKKLWLEGNSDPIRLEDISLEEIEKLESNLGGILPDSYKRIILVQNGGYIKFNAVSMEEDFLPIEFINGLGPKGMLESKYLIDEWDLPQDILIFSGDGNFWYALDYRKKQKNPSVIYIESEDNTIINVANSFEEFLDKLYVHDYEDEEEEIWTMGEAEDIFNKEDTSLICDVLLSFQYPKQEEQKWLFTKLLTFSTHKDLYIRETVLSIISLVKYYLEDIEKNNIDIIKETLEKLKNDDNEDIKNRSEYFLETIFE
ncbi:SMI1/KNR4 family protein, partial [Bacillus sp. JJ722]|uniref:SMI1/KNR4 family protein n=1 Tax=Bacillus sp. JJ722 TaxID=3122973 RepID=UPI002FFFAD5E